MKIRIISVLLFLVYGSATAQSKWEFSLIGSTTLIGQKYDLNDLFYSYYGPNAEFIIGPYRKRRMSFSPAVGFGASYNLTPKLDIQSRLNGSFVKGGIRRSLYNREDSEFLKIYTTSFKQISVRTSFSLAYKLSKQRITLFSGVVVEYLSMPTFHRGESELINVAVRRQLGPGAILGITYRPNILKGKIGLSYTFEGLLSPQGTYSIMNTFEHPHVFDVTSKFSYHSLCFEFVL